MKEPTSLGYRAADAYVQGLGPKAFAPDFHQVSNARFPGSALPNGSALSAVRHTGARERRNLSMVTLARTRNMSHALMVRALELLDGIGEDEATIHLQQAIDTLIGTPVPQTAEEAEAALETPEARRILAWMDRRAAFSAK